MREEEEGRRDGVVTVSSDFVGRPSHDRQKKCEGIPERLIMTELS